MRRLPPTVCRRSSSAASPLPCTTAFGSFEPGSRLSLALAPAKINLALVVGPSRPDGKHDVVTVLERLALGDHVDLEPAHSISVTGFEADSIVGEALQLLRKAANHPAGWKVAIEKMIPVAAGLAGGSSDAAAALALANETLPDPLTASALHAIAASVGADVPFFLTDGPRLATADGTVLQPLALPRDYVVLLVLPRGESKQSTAAVYAAFDDRGGEAGYQERACRLREALAGLVRAEDLASLPPNDLASSPLAAELVALGAFRADVSGAGPAVYGLFLELADAERARTALGCRGRTWITRPI